MKNRWVRTAGARSSMSTMSAPARRCRHGAVRCFPRQRTLGSWQRRRRRAHREQRQAEQLPPLLMFRLWRSACSCVSQVRRLPGRTSPAGPHRRLGLGLCRKRRASDVTPMLAKSEARGTSTRALDPARTRIPHSVRRSGSSNIPWTFPHRSIWIQLAVEQAFAACFGRGQHAFPRLYQPPMGARSSVRIGNTL